MCGWVGGLRETDVTPANESRANRARAQGDPVGLVLRHRAFTCRVSVKTFRGKIIFADKLSRKTGCLRTPYHVPCR